MDIAHMKKRIWSSFVLLVCTIFLLVFTTYAYFTDLFSQSFEAEFGFVDVDFQAYFDTGSETYLAEEVVIDSLNAYQASDIAFTASTHTITSTTVDLSVYSDQDKIRIIGSTSNDGQYTVSGTPTANSLVVEEDLVDETAGATIDIEQIITKPGTYYINIVSSGSPFFFEDFRIYVDVYSNVPTYMRVKIYEQLTLIYTDYQGQVTELSVLFDGYMPFNYDTTNWYDNRINDNYLYYMSEVERINETTPLEIALIPSYFTGQEFGVYSPGYSLQIAFSIEAVQSDGGPENVWELTTPPWGGAW